jgi:Tol biopolymer transport system component
MDHGRFSRLGHACLAIQFIGHGSLESRELHPHAGAENKPIIMTRINLFRWFLICAVLLCGCAINISSSGNNSSQSTQPSVSTETGLSDNLKGLNLSGKLIYTSGKVDTSGGSISLVLIVQSLDLATGEVKTIFKAPSGGWIDSAVVSPDEQSLVMSHQPSSDSGQSGLYVLPLDASRPPQLLFPPASASDRYYQPRWSPDGKYIYFTHVAYQTSGTFYEIMRMGYPNGKIEKVVDQAYWPSISLDSSRLAYVSVDPATGTNELYFANADGTGSTPVPLRGLAWTRGIIDAPMFLSDNQNILFSAPTPLQSSMPNWVDRLMGVTVASAHAAIPSDWWTVPLIGGQPTQLTHIHSYALYASFSPDMKYIASYSSDGIFIMKPDGTGLVNAVNYVGGITGTVDWIR